MKDILRDVGVGGREQLPDLVLFFGHCICELCWSSCCCLVQYIEMSGFDEGRRVARVVAKGTLIQNG